MDKQIYNSYAFTENEREKSRCNYDIFQELKAKYKVFRHDAKLKLVDGIDCNFSDYDVIIGRSAQYHHSLYYIYKNKPNLTTEELALICDGGSLCFGYSKQGYLIRVSED